MNATSAVRTAELILRRSIAANTTEASPDMLRIMGRIADQLCNLDENGPTLHAQRAPSVLFSDGTFGVGQDAPEGSDPS